MNLLVGVFVLSLWVFVFSQDVSFDCTSVSTIPVEECNALVTIFKETDGKNWSKKDKWLQDVDPCSWEGLKCAEGHISSIYLPYNNMSGSLQNSIGDLSECTHLSLKYNAISGSIPSSIGNMKSLTELYVQRNKFTGTIPVELGNLENLERVSMWGNQLTGSIPEEIGNLNNLVELSASSNSISGEIPSQLGKLVKLEKLYLERNDITGPLPDSLGELTKLTTLHAYYNQISGSIPDTFGNLISVSSLRLQRNKLTGYIPAEIGNIKSLSELELWGNDLSGGIPLEFGDLDSLKIISLAYNENMEGPIPRELANLGDLSKFDFRKTDLCVPEDESFQAWMNNISSLQSNDKICDPAVSPASASPSPSSTPSTSPSSTPSPSPSLTPSPSSSPTTSEVGPEIDYCQGISITDNREVSVEPMEKPKLLEEFDDPSFGVKVKRITDAGDNNVIKTPYNTIQSWNADETYIILYHASKNTNFRPGHHLYDGQTYQLIGRLDIYPTDIEHFFWDVTDPDILYFINNKEAAINSGDLVSYNVQKKEQTIIRNFDDVCGSDSAPHAGDDVQMMSWDGDLVGLNCDESNKSFSYRISTNTLSSTREIVSRYAPQSAPSGKLLLQGSAVLDENMAVQREIDVNAWEHSCLGRHPNGNDALFVVNFNRVPNGCNGDPDGGIGTLTLYDLETGECNNVMSSREYGYPLSDIHFSALNRKSSGWVAVSVVGSAAQMRFLENNELAPMLYSEILLVHADPENTRFCRLAHHRSHGKKKTKGTYTAYFGEPHPVLSPSGTRILFNSDWNDSGSVDTYVIELPIYNAPNV